MGWLGIIPIVLGIVLYNWAHRGKGGRLSTVLGGGVIGCLTLFWIGSFVVFKQPISTDSFLGYLFIVVFPIVLTTYIYICRKRYYEEPYKMKHAAKTILTGEEARRTKTTLSVQDNKKFNSVIEKEVKNHILKEKEKLGGECPESEKDKVVLDNISKLEEDLRSNADSFIQMAAEDVAVICGFVEQSPAGIQFSYEENIFAVLLWHLAPVLEEISFDELNELVTNIKNNSVGVGNHRVKVNNRIDDLCIDDIDGYYFPFTVGFVVRVAMQIIAVLIYIKHKCSAEFAVGVVLSKQERIESAVINTIKNKGRNAIGYSARYDQRSLTIDNEAFIKEVLKCNLIRQKTQNGEESESQ